MALGKQATDRRLTFGPCVALERSLGEGLVPDIGADQVRHAPVVVLALRHKALSELLQ